MSSMHRARICLAKLYCPRSCYDLFCHDAAAFRCREQEECMVSAHPCSIAEPTNSTRWDELMDPALDVYAEGVPGEARVLVKLTVRAV
jgi:hypothetical protein